MDDPNQSEMTSRYFSGAPWESKAAYCRAIRRGSLIAVSGTTAVDEHGEVMGVNDGYAQAKRCLEIIAQSLSEVGASLKDVTRTRMFVTDIARWEEFARAHRETFVNHPPATSMLEVKSLIHPWMLIEIEADAYVE